MPWPNQIRIEHAPVIFKGRLSKVEIVEESIRIDVRASFEVADVYKGIPGAVETISYHSDSRRKPNWLKEGHEYFVIPGVFPKTGKLAVGGCSLPIPVEQLAESTHKAEIQLVAELEGHNAKLEEIDRMIAEHPDEGWRYAHKAEVLDEFKDSMRSSDAYEKALGLVRDKKVKWSGTERHSAEESIVTNLVRALYESGKYDKIIELSRLALRDPTPEDSGISEPGRQVVKKFLAAAFIRQRNIEGLKDLAPVDVSGLNLDYVDLSGLTLDHGNFANASLQEAKFGNASLREADFRGANLLGVSYKESDLTGAQYDCTTRLNLVNNPSNQKQMVGPPVCR